MPRIVQYTPRTDARANIAPMPSSTGVGEGLQTLGSSMDQSFNMVMKRKEQDDVSSLNAELAQTQADLTTQWQEKLRTADPSDPNLASDFMTEASQRIQAIGANATTAAGQNFFKDASARLAGQIQVNAAAGQAELAGLKARNDYITSLNGYSSSVYADPQSLDAVMANHNQALDMLVKSGAMPRADALKLQAQGQSEIAKSAVKGLISINPSAAEAALKSGKYDSYLDGSEKDSLFNQVDAEKRSRRVDAELAQARADRAQKAAATQSQNDWLARMQPGSDNPLTAKDVIADPNVTPADKRVYLSALEQDAKKPLTTTNAAVFTDLFQRIHAQDGDPNKITDESQLNQYLGKGLTWDSLNNLRKEFQGGNTEEGKMLNERRANILSSVKAQITSSNPLYGIRDPQGEQLYMGFIQSFQNQEQAWKKSGKPMTEFYDPENIAKIAKPFRRSPTEMFNDLAPDNPNMKLDNPGTLEPGAATPPGAASAPQAPAAAAGGFQYAAPGAEGDPSSWGKRADGSTKGRGFLGVLKRPDGGISTELSVGVSIDGKDMEIPSLVPTLTPAEVHTMLSLKEGEKPPKSVVDKAVKFAISRMKAGKSVWAQPGEQQQIKTAVGPKGTIYLMNGKWVDENGSPVN